MRYDLFKYPRLRNLREEHRLSQKEIAEILNIAQNTYSQYETDVLNPSLDVIVALAHYYKTSIDYLLNVTDIKDPYPRADKKSR